MISVGALGSVPKRLGNKTGRIRNTRKNRVHQTTVMLRSA